MSNNPFTIGEKAKLIANFSGIVKQGTLGVVQQIMHYGIAIEFDGEDFQRVIPRSWLEPFTEEDNGLGTEQTEGRGDCHLGRSNLAACSG
jgi:hypothetical protein